MSGVNCELDTLQDSVYDIFVNRNRTLNQTFEAYFTSGDTEYNFQFTSYSGAILEVKKNYKSNTVLLTFDTDDGSIVLGADGEFKLVKSADELSTIRGAEYVYDMYLKSTEFPKRAFLSGRFLIKDYVTN